jgi:hypothetical protein
VPKVGIIHWGEEIHHKDIGIAIRPQPDLKKPHRIGACLWLPGWATRGVRCIYQVPCQTEDGGGEPNPRASWRDVKEKEPAACCWGEAGDGARWHQNMVIILPQH